MDREIFELSQKFLDRFLWLIVTFSIIWLVTILCYELQISRLYQRIKQLESEVGNG
jgi:hypothetical protein